MIRASRPPEGLSGLDPAWSRIVDVDGAEWHLLERPSVDRPEITVVAVHGNPTWSYLWRRLLAAAPPTWRVIAVDQLEMGFSARTGIARDLAQRIDDLDALVAALDVSGPLVTVGHDWGGPVSLGLALRHRDDLRGVVLLNTAVHQPEGSAAPALIRSARLPGVLPLATERTTAFLRGAVGLSRDVPPEVARAYRAPYASRERRAGIRQFVADIPLEPGHPSDTTLRELAEGVRSLDVPTLILWGPRDPVFGDAHLRDLRDRLPHVDLHRYAAAGHLLPEDAPAYADDVITWIAAHVVDESNAPAGSDAPAATPRALPAGSSRMGAALMARAADSGVAIADLASGRRVTWSMLAARTSEIAAGLVDLGVRPGERIAMAVPPGPDLIASVYAAWRVGAVVVVADSGLGIAGMRAAWRSAAPDHIIGIPAGLALARTIHLPGRRIRVAGPRQGAASVARALPLSHDATLAELAARGRRRLADDTIPPADRLGPQPEPDAEALVAFTSGATGPAKGVVYTHRRLCALRDALAQAYAIRGAGTQRDALVAAFAPWAVLGPALGIASAIPDMDPTDATTLTATGLADAAAAVGGTIVWASPTALSSILASESDLDDAQRVALAQLRLLLVAGAPVPVGLLDRAAELMPEAIIATPYGMTEALPLTQVTREDLHDASGLRGVLVGAPLPDVRIAIAPLDGQGLPAADIVTTPDVTGEIVVSCAWMRERYDSAWAIHTRASRPEGWHRTGDVGHLDEQGRLVVEGRLAHIITTADGVVTPVGLEFAAAEAASVARAAAVGIGPRGTQVVVLVLEDGERRSSLRLADPGVVLVVRRAIAERFDIDVAAVLTMPSLPVDIRHRSKIDRAAVARAASELLAGSRPGDPGSPA